MEEKKSRTNRKRAERLCNFTSEHHIHRCSICFSCLTCKNKLGTNGSYLVFVTCLTPLCSLGCFFILIKLGHQVLLLFLHVRLLSLDGLPPPLLALQSIPARRTRVSGGKRMRQRQQSGCKPQRTSPSSSAASLPGPETSSAGPQWCWGSGGVCTARGCPCTSAWCTCWPAVVEQIIRNPWKGKGSTCFQWYLNNLGYSKCFIPNLLANLAKKQTTGMTWMRHASSFPPLTTYSH